MTSHNQRVIDILTTVASGRIDSQYVTYKDEKWNIVRTKPISGRYQAIESTAPYLKLQIEYFVNSVSV